MQQETKPRDTTLRFRRFFLVCGIAMLLSEVWKQLVMTFLVNEGSYNWAYFPFQLCSTPMYVLLVLPHVRRESLRNALLTFLMTFGLLGGVIVLADPSGLYYPLPALTVHSHLWHVLLATVGILAGVARKGPSIRDFLHAALLYGFFCAVAEVLNLLLGQFGDINMFYINPIYPMWQVVFRDLVPIIGNEAVIALYILMTIVGAAILWGLWKILSLLSRNGKTRNPQRS